MFLSTLGKGVLSAVGLGEFTPVPSRDATQENQEKPRNDVGVQDMADIEMQVADAPAGAEVLTTEVTRSTLGKEGWWLVIVGLCLVMVMHELDNTTVHVYRNYALSEFRELTRYASLSTAGTILFAASTPPFAKLSNVIGRGQTYLLATLLYIASYILMAFSKGFKLYVAGAILHAIGHAGTSILTHVVIADITTAKWRAFGLALSFWPFLMMPWAAGFIVESVMATTGIGWRWGTGILAIILPACASVLIATLWYYQSKARKEGRATTKKISGYEFCSQIDLGGLLMLSGGLGMIFLPLTFVGVGKLSVPSSYWVGTLLGGGIFLIMMLPLYEHQVAKHPVIPLRYFANRTIFVCLLLIALDIFGFSVTHTYIYTWAIAAKGLSARNATFFTYTCGATQAVFAMITGLAMAKTRRYKWLCVLGSAIRFVGYGLMIRLRGPDTSLTEIFSQQIIQGIGSGAVGTSILVPCQIVVSHAEMPLVTSIFMCFSLIGASAGAGVAGAIYSSTIEPALRHYLGSGTTAEAVKALATSMLDSKKVMPAWGTVERVAVGSAFSEVMLHMTYAAVAPAAITFVVSLFLSNFELPEKNNLVEE